MPSEFPVVGYGLTNAFGDLTFNDPVVIASAPGETNRIFIADRSGIIWVIPDLRIPAKSQFLDARDELVAGGEEGLLGLAFHPGFATNGFFYIYRTIRTATEATPLGLHDELARYTADPDNPDRAWPESKQRILIQYDSNDEHNAGTIQFGPDGYLYLSIGNSGPAPGEPTTDLQPIDRHFFGAILRIDVDKRPGNLVPNPYPTGTSQYLIPADNPFIGATNHNGIAVDPNRVRTELYAIGLRNPWRIAFDGADLYCGDVGDGSWEEVDLIRSRGNYGYPFFEGPQQNSQGPTDFAPIPPLYAYTRGNRLDRGHCVIGGVVYRGQKIPQLTGAYVFGDYVFGRIWALRRDGTNVTSIENVAGLPLVNLSAFGIDPANGDVLATSLDGHVLRLVYVDPTTVSVPVTLAETGAFADLATLTPEPGIVPYEVSIPFWSDNAIKSRWFSVPDPAQTIGFDATTNWTFPTGTVWIKHFELELTNGVPESRKRIETRLLVKNGQGVYGVTYRWGDSLTNAQLVEDAGREEAFEIHDGDTTRTQIWVYPGRSDCLNCHNAGAGYSLGFRTPEMNCSVLSNGTAVNQIQLLSTLGYLSNAPASLDALPRLVQPANRAVPIQDRVRSYLDANCSQCHFPDGPSGHLWNARITSPMSAANIIDGRRLSVSDDTRIIKPGDLYRSALYYRITSDHDRMPPLASTVLDTNAANLLAEFILGLPLPPWADQDIGTPGREGSSSILDGVYRVSGSGTNLAGNVDAFHYLFRPLNSNAQLIAHLVSVDTPQASAGIMFRSSVAGNATHATLSLAADGTLQWRRRLADGSETVSSAYANPGSAAWVRLVREDSSLHAYTSENGTNWPVLAEETIDLGSKAVMGFATTASDDGVTATAAFDSVSTMSVTLSMTDAAPSVIVTEPIELHADATADGTTIQRVEFYDGTTKIGEAAAPPYTVIWTNAITGDHLIRASAVSAAGDAVFSRSIAINRSLPQTRLAAGAIDSDSRGNWIGTYGQDGAIIAGVTTNLPVYAAFTFSDETLKVWARVTTAQRALQWDSGSKRTAAAWQSSTGFTVHLAFLLGGLRQVSLYFLDWESGSHRQQQVEIFDAATGVRLASNKISNFNHGVYLSYLVRGEINIRVTRLAGRSAVLSGIFFDTAVHDAPSVQLAEPAQDQYLVLPAKIPLEAVVANPAGIEKVEFFANGFKLGEATASPFVVPWTLSGPGVYAVAALAVDTLGAQSKSSTAMVTAALPAARADLMWTDSATRGNWLGVYGLEGFAIPGHLTNYPPYAAIDLDLAPELVYSPEGGVRELQTADGTSRIFSEWLIESPVDLTFLQGSNRFLTAYFVDPERSRYQRVSLLDGDTGAALSTAELPSFGDGQYLVWKVRGHLKMVLTSVFGPNTYLSGLFFDHGFNAAPGDVQLLPSAPAGNGFFMLNLLRKKTARWASSVVEFSDDLVTWTPAVDGAVTEVETVDLGLSERVSLRLDIPARFKERCFVRVRVSGNNLDAGTAQ